CGEYRNSKEADVTGMDAALVIFFACYGFLVVALLSLFTWEMVHLGAERLAVTHTRDYQWYQAEMVRRRVAGARGELGDTMPLPEPVQEALEEMWAQAPWIEERHA